MNFLRRRNMMSRAGRSGPAPRSRSSRSTSSPNDRARARVAFGGGVRGALTPLQVWKPRFGGYARAGARQGAFAVEFRELNGVFGAFAFSTPSGSPPEARASGDALRGGRATRNNPPNGARARAKPAPARARQAQKIGGEEMPRMPSGHVERVMIWPGSSRRSGVHSASTPPRRRLRRVAADLRRPRRVALFDPLGARLSRWNRKRLSGDERPGPV